jgi:hypothetical protein
MLKSPVLSTPVQRALAGAAATGGAVQSTVNPFASRPSEGAAQAILHMGNWQPSEGADQSSIGWQRNPSEGADQSGWGWPYNPSEGADQSWTYGVTHAPSEGAAQSGHAFGGSWVPSEG